MKLEMHIIYLGSNHKTSGSRFIMVLLEVVEKLLSETQRALQPHGENHRCGFGPLPPPPQSASSRAKPGAILHGWRSSADYLPPNFQFPAGTSSPRVEAALRITARTVKADWFRVLDKWFLRLYRQLHCVCQTPLCLRPRSER